VAKPEPAPESVYERARKALHDVFWDKKNPESCRDIGHGLDASEAAEKKVLALAADNTRLEEELIETEKRVLKLEEERKLSCITDVGYRERAEKAEKKLAALQIGADATVKTLGEVDYQLDVEIKRAEAAERLSEERLDHIVKLEQEAKVIKAALAGIGPHPAEERANIAEARVKELEDRVRATEDRLNGEVVWRKELHSQTMEALSLLHPARPEDGLLPAIRDVLQQLVSERDDAIKLLNPSMPENGLLDAIKQLQQAFILERDTAIRATRALAWVEQDESNGIAIAAKALSKVHGG
jgi:hypothetical protein